MKKDSVEKYIKSTRRCPVIAVTAHCDDSVKKKALSVGIVKVVEKPVDVGMIENILAEYYYKWLILNLFFMIKHLNAQSKK